jgi:tRNA A-37 threonylcarbamoyl transferase component Bud32
VAYRLTAEIGRGAVASVHRAVDDEGRVWAAKRLHPSLAAEGDSAARFEQEARLLAGLSHPNLVEVHGRVSAVAEDGETHEVLLMELVEGGTLDAIIARSAPLTESRVLDRALDVARGLAFAHDAGVIHRDLKPANVMVAHPGEPGATGKVADFGMARASSLAGVDAASMAILGTPAYMAPECIDPLAVDARSDLYALGCIIFEMLTGRVPFDGPTPFAVLEAHRSHPPPSLPPGTSGGLRAVVEALLAKSPGERPQSAHAVVERLEALRDSDSDSVALVPGGADASACAACGEPLIPSLSTCLGCGLPTVRFTPGGHCVLVTGPGNTGEKVDTERRDRLHRWISTNPALGLRAGKWLDERIPRLPFTVVKNVSERSAQALARSIAQLGLEAHVHEGGPMSHPEMRKKAKTLTGRVLAIAATSMAGIWNTGGTAIAVLLFTGVALAVVTARNSSVSVTKRIGRETRALPPAVTAALDRVDVTAPAIANRRHRQSLRAVVRRSVALSEQLAVSDPEIAAELGLAIDRATVAAARLDQLDRRLESLSSDATAESRAVLHERDTWSARLLSLTASLESFAARRASASAGASATRAAESLDDLRARVEALEEVQA